MLTKCWVWVQAGMDISMLMKKMSMDKKNQGSSIRCTIVTDIGTTITDPQPVDKELMANVMAESMAYQEGQPAWVPHEARGHHGEAGGLMAA